MYRLLVQSMQSTQSSESNGIYKLLVQSMQSIISKA
jgi:hypothetical protein